MYKDVEKYTRNPVDLWQINLSDADNFVLSCHRQGFVICSNQVSCLELFVQIYSVNKTRFPMCKYDVMKSCFGYGL